MKHEQRKTAILTPLSKQQRGFQQPSFSRNHSALYLAVSRRVRTVCAPSSARTAWPVPRRAISPRTPTHLLEKRGRKREFGRDEPETRASHCSQTLLRIAPLLRSLSAGSSFRSMRRMGLHYCCGDPILPPPLPLHFYFTRRLRDEMMGRREGRLRASCDPEAIRR